jgi:BirA family biotin operon repressor/biotin-[acetyl-CoA-carboxylase] ligase
MKPWIETAPFINSYVGQTESTNLLLNSWCNEKTVAQFTTVIAGFQTAGRGQRGNKWESDEGMNLLFSTVLYPIFLAVRQQFLLSQIISLAVKEVLDSFSEGFSIKWPNDIYHCDKKIAGILIENDLSGNTISRTIVGTGLNINQEAFHSDAPNPISLRQITGTVHDRKDILQAVMLRLMEYYNQLSNGETEEISSRYLASLYRSRGMHTYTDASGEFQAEIFTVSPEGYLWLKDDKGALRKYAFKEVQYIL